MAALFVSAPIRELVVYWYVIIRSSTE